MTTEDFALPKSATQGDMDRCDRCDCQYAYVDGLIIGGKRQRTMLACSVCDHPAPDDHPVQIELKRQWSEHDKRLQAECKQHQRAADEASQSPYQHVTGIGAIEENFGRLERLILSQNARIDKLEAALARRNK
jgi:hypothetical protein